LLYVFGAFMTVMYFGAFATPRWPLGLGVLAVLLFGATAVAFVHLTFIPGSLPTAVVARVEADPHEDA
jgi:hypothetical protein